MSRSHQCLGESFRFGFTSGMSNRISEEYVYISIYHGQSIAGSPAEGMKGPIKSIFHQL